MIALLAMLMIIFPSAVHNTYHLQFASFKTFAKRSHVILRSNTQRVIRFDKASITSSLSVKLLGITFYLDPKFEEQINKICNIFHIKLNVLHRIQAILT